MMEQIVTVVLDGRPYAARYEVVGHGEAKAVSVQFKNNSISAFAGYLDPTEVAQTLLTDLVRTAIADEGQIRSAKPMNARRRDPDLRGGRWVEPLGPAGAAA